MADASSAAKLQRWLKGGMSLAQAKGFTTQDIVGIAHLAHMLYLQGKTDSAKIIFEGLEALEPNDAFIQSALGAIYLRDENEAAALRHLNRALELKPNDIYALCNRGELRLRASMFQEATEDLRRAIALDPDGNDPAGMRARALVSAIKEIADMAGRKQLRGKR
ncbi:MAG: tetratricopeptide repeat protein [Candidatus Schekmanbacteria bacterium]|nr:tetratricopeptide repeat protein [Candidatus Schekmanbacteria bacterium]